MGIQPLVSRGDQSKDKHLATYQTRPAVSPTADVALTAYAELYGQAERSLFARIQAGKNANKIKPEFQAEFGLSSRQFNAISINLDGKIASITERRPELIAEAEQRVTKLTRRIDRQEKYLNELQDPAAALKSGRTVKPRTPAQRQDAITSVKFKLHQNRRKLYLRTHRLAKMKADEAAGTVRLCFGTKKLFHAQFNLTENGYLGTPEEAHRAWLADWRAERSKQFFVLGSKDETGGCQGCVATVAPDGSLTLRLRLPDRVVTTLRENESAFGPAPKGEWPYITFSNVRFAYGHDAIVRSLQSSCWVANAQTQAGTPTKKRTGTAISYRFLKDDRGWRIFATTEAVAVSQTTSRQIGVVGIDINADHLAVTNVDRFGNLVHADRWPCVTYGLSSDQATAVIGDIAKRLAVKAAELGQPIAIEKLDFTKKKLTLAESNPRRARQLSSFAYNKVISAVKAASYRAGVEVLDVDPAYTSVIGAVKFAQSKGISVHQGAALAIARKSMGFSEPTPCGSAFVPTRNGGHVTFTLPVRNRGKHVRSYWGDVRKRAQAAHKAHYRCGDHKKPPPPLRPVMARTERHLVQAGAIPARQSQGPLLALREWEMDIPF